MRKGDGDLGPLCESEVKVYLHLMSLLLLGPANRQADFWRHKTMRLSRPILFVVKTNGNWTVQAEWPDGTVEEVKTFKAELQALDWLTWQSQTWLAWRETDFSSCS
jgi:hypothetical protein